MEGEKEIQETFDMLTAEEKSYLIFPQERQQEEQGHQLSGHGSGMESQSLPKLSGPVCGIQQGRRHVEQALR